MDRIVTSAERGKTVTAIYLGLYGLAAFAPLLLILLLAPFAGSGPGAGIVIALTLVRLLPPVEFLPLLVLTGLMIHLAVLALSGRISKRWLLVPMLYYGVAFSAPPLSVAAASLLRAHLQAEAGDAVGAARPDLPIVVHDRFLSTRLAEWMPDAAIFSDGGRVVRITEGDCSGDLRHRANRQRCWVQVPSQSPAPALHLSFASPPRAISRGQAPVLVDVADARGVRRRLGKIQLRGVYTLAPGSLLQPHCFLSSALLGCRGSYALRPMLVWPATRGRAFEPGMRAEYRGLVEILRMQRP